MCIHVVTLELSDLLYAIGILCNPSAYVVVLPCPRLGYIYMASERVYMAFTTVIWSYVLSQSHQKMFYVGGSGFWELVLPVDASKMSNTSSLCYKQWQIGQGQGHPVFNPWSHQGPNASSVSLMSSSCDF